MDRVNDAVNKVKLQLLKDANKYIHDNCCEQAIASWETYFPGDANEKDFLYVRDNDWDFFWGYFGEVLAAEKLLPTK